jgi:cardiolipin synthase
MGQYRPRDLIRVPGLLSLARIPLALSFPLLVSHPAAALAVLVLAAVTDVLDGFYARRYHQATPTGAVLDGITDKLFVFAVLFTLAVNGHLPIYGLFLLGTRELGELPLVIWWLFSRHRRKARAEDPRANVAGKAATVFQFAAVTLALFEHSATLIMLWIAAAVGVVAAISYWRRELA